MRIPASILIGAALLTSTMADARPRISPEAKLAKALEGRVAGEPVDCVNLRNVRSSRVIEGTAILYETGSTIYVNYPEAGRESLNQWDALVSHPFSSRLCDVDVIKMVDLQSQMQTGLVFL